MLKWIIGNTFYKTVFLCVVPEGYEADLVEEVIFFFFSQYNTKCCWAVLQNKQLLFRILNISD